jgi:hypothetical protein
MLSVLVIVVGLSAAPVVELKTGGGMPGETRFHVTVSAAGEVRVQRESLPIVRGGLTTRNRSVQLDAGATQRLLQLATDATDFAAGCDAVGDGSDAMLVVRNNGQEATQRCRNARSWPTGGRTRRFLDELNSHLPDDWKVF